jgi:hypothetical protein
VLSRLDDRPRCRRHTAHHEQAARRDRTMHDQERAADHQGQTDDGDNDEY